MKKQFRLFAVGLLAATIAAMIGGTAWHAAAGPILASKSVLWRDVNAPVASDTTYLTDEGDTTRTMAIYTDDWDWAAIGQSVGGATTGAWAARVYFVSPVSNGVSDSLYFTIETGASGAVGGTAATAVDTIFTYNAAGLIGSGTTIAATLGSSVPSGGTCVWTALLPVDPDTPGTTTNIWMAPKFRLRVFGDVSGSSPKNSGLRCIIVYPKRQESP